MTILAVILEVIHMQSPTLHGMKPQPVIGSITRSIEPAVLMQPMTSLPTLGQIPYLIMTPLAQRLKEDTTPLSLAEYMLPATPLMEVKPFNLSRPGTPG